MFHEDKKSLCLLLYVILILLKIAQVWNVSLKQNDKYQTAKTFWRFALNEKKPKPTSPNTFSAIILLISKI